MLSLSNDPRNTTPEDWKIFSSKLPTHWQHTHYASIPTTMEAIDVTALSPDSVQLVTADEQTAGRGQRGTHWESEPAKNLTFSFAFRPKNVRANAQFLLSEIACLAVAQTLSQYTEGITVKWPNDIYFRDQKICGMLLEHQLCGAFVDTTLVGMGINLNQTVFCSDAPNPISLYQIVGQEVDRADFLLNLIQHFEQLYRQLQDGHCAFLEETYRKFLYRREGFHPYQDTRSGEVFSAAFVEVASNGLLTLRTSEGENRTFAFKEIKFIL